MKKRTLLLGSCGHARGSVGWWKDIWQKLGEAMRGATSINNQRPDITKDQAIDAITKGQNANNPKYPHVTSFREARAKYDYLMKKYGFKENYKLQ